jgi:hypothetical protein
MKKVCQIELQKKAKMRRKKIPTKYIIIIIIIINSADVL